MVRSLWFTAALAFALGSLPALAGPIYLAEQLLPLSGDIFVQARAINAVGEVVGYSRSPEGRNSAVLWDDGDVIDLSPGATMGLGYVANDINDVGQIVGAGYVCEPSCPEFVPIPLSAGSVRPRRVSDGPGWTSLTCSGCGQTSSSAIRP